MMTRPYVICKEEHEVIALYDSFIKKVLKNRSRTLKKRYYHQAQCGELATIQLFCRQNNSLQPTYENEILLVDGLPIHIESNALYEALLTLPEQHLLVIMLTFWFEWSTTELAKRFHVTDRTIRNWREKALSELQKQLDRDDISDASIS